MNECTFKNFLEDIPPGKSVFLTNEELLMSNGGIVITPEINLFCTADSCGGVRYFSSNQPNNLISLSSPESNNLFLTYRCKNCGQTTKIFSIEISYNQPNDKWQARKFGEFPSFGPATPARAIKLIGPDKELFLLGRRSESQGMGIGAFVYYRRVVEHQKNRIFDEIIKATKVISPNDELVSELEAAKKKTNSQRLLNQLSMDYLSHC